VEALENRIHDELLSVQLYCVDSKNGNLMEASEALFGEGVASRFPELSFDIEESGKCLALRRATASVFHLMRVMERAVQLISTSLNIKNPEREWGKLLSDIHAAIETMEKGARRDEWSAAHANLYHVKQAWRNTTMHPRKTYTEEQAEEIFRAVKAFMAQMSGLV
jgi:hypothetical protein